MKQQESAEKIARACLMLFREVLVALDCVGMVLAGVKGRQLASVLRHCENAFE
jgi:hypothetical protein